MARPPKAQQNGAQNEESATPSVAKFDKCLLVVKRKGTVDAAGRMKGTTMAVEVRDIIRANMPGSQHNMDKLNAQVDWQNPGAEGVPVIIQYLPAGSVRTGDKYKANDIAEKVEDEEGNMVKTGKLIGLRIHLDKPGAHYDGNGKLVLEAKHQKQEAE